MQLSLTQRPSFRRKSTFSNFQNVPTQKATDDKKDQAEPYPFWVVSSLLKEGSARITGLLKNLNCLPINLFSIAHEFSS